MELLERKIDTYLQEWKNNSKWKPLIVKGARQIGKTESLSREASFFWTIFDLFGLRYLEGEF